MHEINSKLRIDGADDVRYDLAVLYQFGCDGAHPREPCDRVNGWPLSLEHSTASRAAIQSRWLEFVKRAAPLLCRARSCTHEVYGGTPRNALAIGRPQVG